MSAASPQETPPAAKRVRTSWLIVSFGEHERAFCLPRLGSARSGPAGGSSATCSIPLRRPGAAASSPPCITKTDDEPGNFGELCSIFHLPLQPDESYSITCITLPVDQEHVQATYHDGVLELRLPKSEAAKPTRVAITG
jgi:Hsp20/alpha crystallin family